MNVLFSVKYAYVYFKKENEYVENNLLINNIKAIIIKWV